MSIITAHSTLAGELEAVAELAAKFKQSNEELKLIIFTCTVVYNTEEVFAALKKHFPNVPFQGGTSCNAVMTEDGLVSDSGRAMAAIAFSGDGEYGVGSAPKEGNPKQAAQQALEQAIDNAERSGELPSAIWLIGPPGGEEEVIEGLGESVGSYTPLIGGSSADNTIEGYWKQFTNTGLYNDHICVVAIFNDHKKLVTSFHSGYDPSSKKGKVTKAADRIIQEIDNQPASEVYNMWSEGAIDEQMEGGVILGPSNLFPLGRRVGSIAGVDYYCLSHPERVTEDKGITLFTDISIGEEVTCMNGSVDLLIARAGNVISSALEKEKLTKDQITGALIIFCAGCMLTIGDRMTEAVGHIKKELGEETPFLSLFTFGEQGSLAGGENRHGNLMISVLLFTDKDL